jgi:hypothetical protein
MVGVWGDGGSFWGGFCFVKNLINCAHLRHWIFNQKLVFAEMTLHTRYYQNLAETPGRSRLFLGLPGVFFWFLVSYKMPSLRRWYLIKNLC